MNWQPPRCEHDNIILGCPHDDCTDQNNYLVLQQAQVERYHEGQRRLARRIVREALGLDEGKEE